MEIHPFHHGPDGLNGASRPARGTAYGEIMGNPQTQQRFDATPNAGDSDTNSKKKQAR